MATRTHRDGGPTWSHVMGPPSSPQSANCASALRDPACWWLSKFFRARTCWRLGGREFSSKLHSRSAYRHRMLGGSERPVCLPDGRIRVAKPVPMTQESEQRQQQSAVALFLSLSGCLG